MKATGIVRRIDDLGRIVIPKEIRRTFRLREGDPLEIFTSNIGEIIFKKYSPVGDIVSYINGYADVLFKVSKVPVVICDKDHIISCAGISKKEVLERRISKDLEEVLLYRKIIKSDDMENEHIQVMEGKSYKAICCYPILISYDVCGAIMFITDGNIKVEDKMLLDSLLQTAVGFISSQMET